MAKTLCIFHSNATSGHCDDGFAAAWCVRNALGESNVEFFPGVYGRPPPDVGGRDVVIVDFSYKRPVIEAMMEKVESLIILDHHKTAEEDLKGLAAENYTPGGRSYVKFDMERSGAGLAWDYFHPNVMRPRFIDYIEDRDLWRKALPNGDEFTIALRSYPQDFETWDRLVPNYKLLIEEGIPLQRYYRLRVEELKRSAYKAVINTPLGLLSDEDARTYVACRVANAPYFAASEVAGELATDDVHFGASYFEVEAGKYYYSLRSRSGASGFDVSAIAKRFGGGGHRNAAGFTSDFLVHTAL